MQQKTEISQEETEILQDIASKPPNTNAKKKNVLREWTEVIVIAILMALVVRAYVIQAFKIPSGSMEDTLLVGDHLFVNKFIYGTKIPFADLNVLKLRDPRQGDVVVFEWPVDPSKDYIKRIIGTPGDVVEGKDKKIYVNGIHYKNPHEVHKEDELIPKERNPRDTFGPLTVPANSYFVLGDNRDRSYDSRFWGFVTQDKIKGLAFIKYWSWDWETFKPRLSRIGKPIN